MSTTSPRYVPDPPTGCSASTRAVELALPRIGDADVATRWSDAAPARRAASDPLPTDPDWAGGTLYVDDATRAVDAAARGAVAGDRGHRRRARLVLVAAAWAVRGLARQAGRRRRAAPGPPQPRRPAGRRRRSTSGGSRRSSTGGCSGCGPRCGCPGEAWLEWASSTTRRAAGVPPAGDLLPAGPARPRLLVGRLPFHGVVFGGMLRNIAAAAVATAAGDGPSS